MHRIIQNWLMDASPHFIRVKQTYISLTYQKSFCHIKIFTLTLLDFDRKN